MQVDTIAQFLDDATMSMQLPRPAVVAFDAHTGNWQLLDIIVLPVLGDPLLAAGPSVVLECLTAVTAAQLHPLTLTGLTH